MPSRISRSRRRPALAGLLALAVAGGLAPPAGASQAPPLLRPRVVVAPVPVSLVPAPVLATSTQNSSTAQGRTAAAAPRAGAASRLGEQVRAALQGSTARTVAVAVEVDAVGVVHRAEAGHALPPASTQKTWVASAALLALGPAHRFRTEVASAVPPAGGVLRGHAWLVAGGDPYLTMTGLRDLARSVRAAGVTTVTGDLLLDDSRYDARRGNPGWKPEWVPSESGPLSALAIDGNRWRRDGAFLADPALPAAVRFRELLAAEGVRVVGTVRRNRRPAGAQTLAELASGPLAAVVRRMMKDSDNFASELVLKELGRVAGGDGSSVGGLRAAKARLAAHGVALGAGSDGSGLSSQDRQTPDGQVALLAALAATDVGDELRAALPVACVDGTLEKRLCGTPAAGNARAKTGTLSGVTSLAGYVTTRSGRTARFAFQLTGVQSATRARAAIDRAVVALASSAE